MIRFVTLCALLSPLAACMTEQHPLHGILIQPVSSGTPGDGYGALLINLSRCKAVKPITCPAVTPHLRVRLNGELLLTDSDGKGDLTDDVFAYSGDRTVIQTASLLPPGDYLVEFITDDDQTWSSSTFHLPDRLDHSASQLFVSGDAVHSWYTTPGDWSSDHTTLHTEYVNMSDTPIGIDRCVQGPSDPAETCTTLATVAPLTEWIGDFATESEPYATTKVNFREVANGQTIGGVEDEMQYMPYLHEKWTLAEVNWADGSLHPYTGAEP
jgi:hypothetical protein